MAMKEDHEKRGLTSNKGTFEIKGIPEIETTNFNWAAERWSGDHVSQLSGGTRDYTQGYLSLDLKEKRMIGIVS